MLIASEYSTSYSKDSHPITSNHERINAIFVCVINTYFIEPLRLEQTSDVILCRNSGSDNINSHVAPELNSIFLAEFLLQC
jgi:hypothetical protein